MELDLQKFTFKFSPKADGYLIISHNGRECVREWMNTEEMNCRLRDGEKMETVHWDQSGFKA